MVAALSLYKCFISVLSEKQLEAFTALKKPLGLLAVKCGLNCLIQMPLLDEISSPGWGRWGRGEGVTRLGIPGKDSPWGEFNPFDPPAEISESQHRKNGYPTWGRPPT